MTAAASFGAACHISPAVSALVGWAISSGTSTGRCVRFRPHDSGALQSRDGGADRGRAMNIREPQQLNPADASKLPGRPNCNWFSALPGSRYRPACVRTNRAAPGASPNPQGCKHWAAGSAGSTRSRSKALQDQQCYQTWNVLFSSIEKGPIASFFPATTGTFTGWQGRWQ